MDSRIVIAANVVVAIGGWGCSEEPVACTEIGCSDSFTLELRADDGEFEAGVYTLTTTVDGTEEVCEFEIRVTCESGGQCVTDETCDLLFAEGTVSFAFAETPEQIDYQLRRDGLLIAEAAVTPEYEEVQPNGPDCPPVCRQAVETVEIP